MLFRGTAFLTTANCYKYLFSFYTIFCYTCSQHIPTMFCEYYPEKVWERNGICKEHSTKMSRPGTSRRNHNNYINSNGNGGAAKLTSFTFASHTVACERHPDRNEDSIITDERRGLAAVFDGVGGSAAGEVASRIAAHTTHEIWKQILQTGQKGRKVHSILEDCNAVDLCAELERIILEADEKVRTDGKQRAGTDDLATTVAIAALCRNPDQKSYTLVYAHVGDSRIYLLPYGGTLKRLTSDDGLLAKLVENQVVNEAAALHIDQAMRADELTEMEFSYFRLRGGITQALGGPIQPMIHTSQISISPGDRVLLCTDGIHDNLTDVEIEEILRSEARNTISRLLVERSIERSHQDRHITIRSKPDDMSAIVMTCRF